MIVQHIPPVFSLMSSDRMNNTTQLNVKEAESGGVLEKGGVLIAPGDKHLRIGKIGGTLRAEVSAA